MSSPLGQNPTGSGGAIYAAAVTAVTRLRGNHTPTLSSARLRAFPVPSALQTR